MVIIEFRDLDFLKQTSPVSKYEQEPIFDEIKKQFDEQTINHYKKTLGKGGFGCVSGG